MCKDGIACDKFRERGHRVHGGRRIRDVKVADVGERGDLGRDGAHGVDEGLEALLHHSPTDARRRYLDELAVPEGEPRRLGVENDEVLSK